MYFIKTPVINNYSIIIMAAGESFGTSIAFTQQAILPVSKTKNADPSSNIDQINKYTGKHLC